MSLREMVGHVEKSLNFKEFTMAVFNSVEISLVVSAINRTGVDPIFTRWTNNRLKGRIDNSSLGYSTEKH